VVIEVADPKRKFFAEPSNVETRRELQRNLR
jgi:hypothetical protein